MAIRWAGVGETGFSSNDSRTRLVLRLEAVDGVLYSSSIVISETAERDESDRSIVLGIELCLYDMLM